VSLDVTTPQCPRCAAPARTDARFCRACGTPLAAPPAPRPPTDDQVAVVPVPVDTTASALRPVDRPRRWWRSRRVQLSAAALVITGIVGWYALVTLIDRTHPPDGPVKDLFAALAAHDGERARSLIDCGPACAGDALRTGYEPPTGVEITSTRYGTANPDDQTRRPNRNRAVVAVRYHLGADAHTDAIGLQRTGTGLVRTWHITRPPGALLDITSTAVPRAHLAGAEVRTVTAPAAGRNTAGAIRALPGRYTLAGDDTPLLAATSTTVDVAGDRGERIRIALTVTVKPAALDSVRQQIRTRIDTCAQQPTLTPTSSGGRNTPCPWRGSTQYTFTRNIRWTVVDYPTVTLRLDDASAVTVHTTTPGHVRLDYESTLDVLEPRRWAPQTATVEVTVAGAVTSAGNTISWTG
jgi:hypothetical protein